MKSYIVAISGASGAIFGLRLVEALLKTENMVYLLVSETAFFIIKTETGVDIAGNTESSVNKKIRKHFSSDHIQYFAESNLTAPVASGSFVTDGMFVVPCSMKTLSGIANGYANNLIERAADVVLKEGRMLVLSPREMPFSAIHLEHMLKLARLGVKIAPPVPAFYHKPKDINGIIDFVVGKLLDVAGVNNNLFKRWK
ncbi:MAG: UbiX family flavin prenyltransferase [Nitrospirae bacterium]|nr:UbiX family flavin prenyltransferase [Nitrospirota bacterium]